MGWDDYQGSSFKASDVMALFIISFFGSAILFGLVAFVIEMAERWLAGRH